MKDNTHKQRLLTFLRVGLGSMVIVFLVGCAGNHPNAKVGAVSGGALGAIAGGIIGHQSGHALEGAAIGAGVGALSGGTLGSAKDDRERQAIQHQHHQRQW